MFENKTQEADRRARSDHAARRDVDTLDTFEPEDADAFRQSLHDAIETARSQRAEADRRALEKLYASRAALDEQIAEIQRRQARA